jgi:hypothetical protein
MVNNTQDKCSISIEELFEYAAEDITTYLQAAQSWSEPPEGYSYGYLFILIFSNRARGRRAFELMGTKTSEKYVDQREQLDTLWKEAERIITEQIFKNDITLKEIINGELTERIDDLKSSLQEVRHIAQDGDLIDDPDWVAEDLENTATDFLLRFQDMYLTKEELAKSHLRGIEGFETFQKRFNEIEGYFRKYFGYFYPVRDFLFNMKKREYNMDTWWFTYIPERDEVKEEEIPEDVVRKFWDIYKSTDKITTEGCPDEEKVKAYASGKLSSNERINIRNHVLKCRLCMDKVMDVRYEEAVSKEVEGDEASERSFKEVRAKPLEKSPVHGIVGFLTGVILVQQIRIRALQRRVLYGEDEQGISELSPQLSKSINLRLKIDERGKYTLPDSPEKEYCDSPEDYRKINEFIRRARTYWGGFAIKGSDEIKKINPDLIRSMSLSRLEIRIDPKENYKSVIIGIAGNEEDLSEGLKALEEKDKNAIASLNVIWLISTLE